MFSKPEVHRITQSLASDFGGDTIESADSISVELRRGAKKVCIDWPTHDLAEVWMTFFDEEDETETATYQDWFECMEGEDKAEFVEYTRTLTSRFFEHPSRIRRRGLFFRRWMLEIQTDNGWKDIMDPELDR